MVRGSESAGGDGAAISHQDGPARRRGDEPPPANAAAAWASGGSKGAESPLASPNVAHCVAQLMTENG